MILSNWDSNSQLLILPTDFILDQKIVSCKHILSFEISLKFFVLVSQLAKAVDVTLEKPFRHAILKEAVKKISLASETSASLYTKN